MKIAITRLKEYEEEAKRVAIIYGFDIFFAPMITTRLCYEPLIKDFFIHLTKGEVDFVIFISANSVRYMFENFITSDFSFSSSIGENKEEKLVKMLNKTNVVAIGPNTKEKLEKHAINVRIMPKEYSSRGIAENLSDKVRNKRVMIVRSKKGREDLKKKLELFGANVHELRVYDIESPSGEEEEKGKKLVEMIKNREIDAVTFTSSMCVRNFFCIAEKIGAENEIKKRMREIMIAAIGKPTAEELKKHGINNAIVPKNFTFEDMLKKIKSFHISGKGFEGCNVR